MVSLRADSVKLVGVKRLLVPAKAVKLAVGYSFLDEVCCLHRGFRGFSRW